jgi:hypothetical protein
MAAAVLALLGDIVATAQTAPPASHSAKAAASSQRQVAAEPFLQNEEPESEAKPDDASHQGIKVHGHWKIDIKNPNGSLASTHEFENSLYDGGVLLAYLLASMATAGEAAIVFGTNNASPCGGNDCEFYESSTGYWATTFCASNASSCAFNLNVTVSVPTVGPLGPDESTPISAQLVLSASIVASANGSIDSVATTFAACAVGNGYASVTPLQCHSGTVPAGSINNLSNLIPLFPGSKLTQSLAFTSADFSNSISVLSGQTIQVTVTLSFS